VPRRLALAALTGATFMIILSETIVNVALRAIQDDLGFSAAGLAWVVTAYMVPFGGLLLLAGRIGDLLGRRSVFLAGLAVFSVASLLCALATGPFALIAARFLQGAGAALAASVALGMLVTIFPEPSERAGAIAVYSAVGAAGASIGVTAGGLITDAVGWHWIFVVTVPIGFAAFAVSLRALPVESGLGRRGGADAAGGLLVTAGLMLGVYAIVTTSHRIGAGVAAAVLLAALAVRQATATRPLVPPRVLRSRAVVVANLVTVVTVAAMFGFQFLVGLYLQRVLGFDAARTGLAFLPVTVAIATVSLGVAGRAAARFGPRAVLVAGLVLIVAGYALLSRLPVDGSYAEHVLPALLLLGAGVGLVLPAVTGLAMSGATSADSGIASGLANTTQQVGGALGLAALATLAGSRAASSRAAGVGEAAALVAGYRLAFTVGLALVVIGAVLAALALPGNRNPSPRTGSVAGSRRSSARVGRRVR
jgi:EmrB/QacA subfamily drug resistance transporter